MRIRRDLVLENIALRHQLLVLSRSSRRPRLRPADRLFWSCLARHWTSWRDGSYTHILLIDAESGEVRKHGKKHLATRDASSFREWLADYYAGDFRDLAQKNLEPIYRKYAEEAGPLVLAEVGGSELPEEFRDIAQRYAKSHAARYSKSSSGQLLAALEGRDGDPLEAIDEKLSLWSETRPTREGKRNGTQAGEALAKTVFVASGFSLVWRTQGENCPLCNELNGKKVGGGGSFVGKGQTLAPSGVASLTVSQNITHAPLHDGCNCYVSAG